MKLQSGFSFIEILVVLVILSLAVAIAMPNLFRVQRTVDLRRLAGQIATDAMMCRREALTASRNVALVFDQEDGRWFYQMVADSNWNGVSRRELADGIDKPIGPRIWLEFLSAGARVGVPSEWCVPDPSGSGTIDGSGLRIGLSAIISFSARGTATPCSVYFNDGDTRMLAVRIAGQFTRIRTLEWQRGWAAWKEMGR
jgi:prepilin-type N-terminal cleavage/methylation domain-containing protein